VYGSAGKIYVGTNGGGLAISSDHGNTFSVKTTANGLGSNLIRSVYASGNNVYVGTSGGFSFSSDGGQIFVNRTSGLPSSDVKAISVSAGNIYVIAGGLAFSTDNGQNFTNISIPLAQPWSANSVYALGSVILVGTDWDGLLMSVNGGTSFVIKAGGSSGLDSTLHTVYNSGSAFYVGQRYNGFSYSSDLGSTWVNKTRGQGLVGNTIQGFFLLGSTLYAASNDGLSITSDGGVTFSNKTTSSGLGSNDVRAIFVE
jgi:hypothetical protein